MRKSRTQEEWVMLIEQYNSSQLSVKEFCKQYGINRSSFYEQRKKLLATSQSPELTGFIQAVVKDTNVTPIAHKERQVITLLLNQCTVTLPAATSASYLATLLRALS